MISWRSLPGAPRSDAMAPNAGNIASIPNACRLMIDAIIAINSRSPNSGRDMDFVVSMNFPGP